MQNEEKRTLDVVGYNEEDKIALNEMRCEEIVVEINTIRRQQLTQMLYASVEIGRLLCEAKDKLPHGMWGEWLEVNFAYSQSTANNLMKLYRNYGESEQIDMFFSDGEKMDIFGNLTPSQAIALLGLPERERTQYVQTHDMERTSVRDIEDAVKARKEAEARADAAEGLLCEYKESAERAESEADEARRTVEELRRKCEADAKAHAEELAAVKASASDSNIKEEKKKLKEKLTADFEKKLAVEKKALEDKLSESDKQIGELEARLSAARAEAARELEAEYNQKLLFLEERAKSAEGKLANSLNSAVQKFAVHFELFQGEYNTLKSLLAAMRERGDANADKLSGALLQIVNTMKEGGI